MYASASFHLFLKFKPFTALLLRTGRCTAYVSCHPCTPVLVLLAPVLRISYIILLNPFTSRFTQCYAKFRSHFLLVDPNPGFTPAIALRSGATIRFLSGLADDRALIKSRAWSYGLLCSGLSSGTQSDKNSFCLISGSLWPRLLLSRLAHLFPLVHDPSACQGCQFSQPPFTHPLTEDISIQHSDWPLLRTINLSLHLNGRSLVVWVEFSSASQPPALR